MPSVGAHYDLVNRLTGDDPHRDEPCPEGLLAKATREPGREHKLEKGEKMADFDEGDARRLAERYRDDARRALGPERLLDLLGVRTSLEPCAGHLAGGIVLSGDGSALHIHASSFGRRVVEDADADDGDGGPPRTHRHAAPDADIGWDSDKEEYYLGFHDVSWHMGELGLDLPVFIAQRAASQHDAPACVSAVAHMLDVDPALKPEFFCHDSAADAAHIFAWARRRGFVPIIDWNQRQSSKDPDERRPVGRSIKDDDGRPLEYINSQGIPVCACGHEMVRDGYDRSKMATKYRCPFAVGRIESCERWLVCTPSEYGRVIKTYDRTDYKLFGPVPYGSDRWKEIYKDRTSTERVDNRVPVLNAYLI